MYSRESGGEPKISTISGADDWSAEALDLTMLSGQF